MRSKFLTICVLIASFFLVVSCDGPFLLAVASIDECNEKQLLTPSIDRELEFRVFVRNLLFEPLPDVLVEVSFIKSTCIGESFEVYFEELRTNENGIIEGMVPYHWQWKTDAGEWHLELKKADYNFRGYVKQLDVNTTSLYSVLTITELED